MGTKSSKSKLPNPTVKFLPISNNDVSEATVRGMVCNPVYAGVPPYPRLVSDEAWIQAALELIEEDGAEQFLVNMLYMLRNSMVSAVPDEAIPDNYDGPWPDDEADREDDGWIDADDSPAPWQNPVEGFLYCSHDDLPMIFLDDEFVCVGEYLKAHLEESPITDLITEPVLTLIFQNGHTLPLLCPDCGKSLHITDSNELLDTLNGLTILDVEWEPDIEELYLIFGLPDSEPDEEELPDLAVHLNAVRELTCPHKSLWEQDMGDSA